MTVASLAQVYRLRGRNDESVVSMLGWVQGRKRGPGQSLGGPRKKKNARLSLNRLGGRDEEKEEKERGRAEALPISS